MTTTTDAHKVEVMPMNVGMSAINRCDRCGAQAFYEFEVGYTKEVEPGRLHHVKTTVMFCAHHANEHHEAVINHPAVVRVFDHRPALKGKS